MNIFSQRSSIVSSFLTGFIGWVGWMFIGPLLFGFNFPALELFLIAIVSTIIQISFLRVLFFPLQMHRHLFIGVIWGLITAVLLFYSTKTFFFEMNSHYLYWLLIYIYIGAPIGGFLSYFYIDDKKIFVAAGGQHAVKSYGRDAHWMEPFGFGVLAYLIGFFPFAHFDLTMNVIIVGAISGVAAAGASHFSPDKWKQSIISISIIILVVGTLQGILTGFLLRSYASQLLTSYAIHGISSGVLTYLMTFIRGRQLAAKEAKQEL